MKSALAALVLAAGVATATSPAAAATTPAPDLVELHVATSGTDTNPGTAAAPLRSVQKAIDLATPGDTIFVHAGTYAGKLSIRKSGTAAAPITLTAAGDGPVTVTSNPSPVSCDSSQPAADRTIMIGGGADYWHVEGLKISGGIYVSGGNTNAAFKYFTNFVNVKDWQSRRAIPGRGTNDPVAARGAIDFLSRVTGSTIDPSDGLEFRGNEITGRGIHVATGRYGTIADNTIHDIDCGTGPGVWLITFSDGWTVTGNDVSRVMGSTYKHYMQEGIRIGSASNYNLVEGNVVHDLVGDGRGFNTDVDSSFNVFRGNTASNVAIGFNEQMAGWGNTWESNIAEGYAKYGFAFRMMDGSLPTPSMDTSTNGAIVRCNTASSGGVNGMSVWVGASMRSTFSGNDFNLVGLSKNAKLYWGAQGNTWNGSSLTPAKDQPLGGRLAICGPA